MVNAMATMVGDVLYIPKMGQLPTQFCWKSQGLLGKGLALSKSGEAHLHQRHIVHHRGGNTCSVSKPGDIGF
jgi:hypothetical protein